MEYYYLSSSRHISILKNINILNQYFRSLFYPFCTLKPFIFFCFFQVGEQNTCFGGLIFLSSSEYPSHSIYNIFFSKFSKNSIPTLNNQNQSLYLFLRKYPYCLYHCVRQIGSSSYVEITLRDVFLKFMQFLITNVL